MALTFHFYRIFFSNEFDQRLRLHIDRYGSLYEARNEIKTPIIRFCYDRREGDGTRSLRPISGFFFRALWFDRGKGWHEERTTGAYYFLSAVITAWRGVAWREVSVSRPVTRQLEQERRENRSFRCNEP